MSLFPVWMIYYFKLFFLRLSSSIVIYIINAERSDPLFLILSVFPVWAGSCRWDWKDKLKGKKAKRDLFSRLQQYPNKSQRQEWAFVVKQAVGFPKALILHPGGVRLDTGDAHMQVCQCPHTRRQKVTRRIVLLVLHFQTHSKKAQVKTRMKQWIYSVILNVCSHLYVCCVCMGRGLRNGISVSAASHSVSKHILIQIHHENCFPSSITVFDSCGPCAAASQERLRGSLAAGCPLAKNTH